MDCKHNMGERNAECGACMKAEVKRLKDREQELLSFIFRLGRESLMKDSFLEFKKPVKEGE